jgi:hypothetical protein
MSIIKRPPGDDFTFRLFFKLKDKVRAPASFVYVWSCVLDPIYEFGHWPDKDVWKVDTELDYRIALEQSVKSDLIIIGVKDHLSSGNFNYWKDSTPIIAEYLKNLFEYYPDKKFVLLTSVENLEAYINLNNARIVPWGGDITNHQKGYKALDPVLDKNFDSKYTFLSLNRNKRAHRAMLISLLYGLDLDKHGLISCMFQESIDDLYDYTQWPELEIYKQGFSKFKSSKLALNDNPEIYANGNNDNVSNFKNKLSNYYRDTFVEIITETSYTEHCYNLTEKTLNSIYGCCFPILLCGQGSVAFLRNMGMDVFDDIINHRYDEIADPADRLYAAINDNIAVLTNPNIKEIWQQNKHRFMNNVDFARETLYNFYSTRAESVFSKSIHDFNI